MQRDRFAKPQAGGFQLLTLFARKEPTADPVSRTYGLGHKLDTVLYRDRDCRQLVARWPWYLSSCPRRNHRRVMLNCFRWNLSWVA